MAAVADLDYPGTLEVLWQRPDAGDHAYWKMDSGFDATSADRPRWQGQVLDTKKWAIIYDLDNLINIPVNTL